MQHYSNALSSENASNITCMLSDCRHNGTAYNYSHKINYSWPSELICVFDASSDDLITSPAFQIFVYFMYFVVFIVALLGNGLVCFVVKTTPRMKTVTNYFIMNLAVGDILMTLFCVPFSFVSMLVLRYWPFGVLMCKLVNFSQAVSVLVSAYTLLAISIDRYIVIMRPLKPRLGKAAAKLIVACVWAGALITAAPIPIVSQLLRPSLWHVACQVDVCGEQWATTKQSERYTCALLALQFALPLSALVWTYARIAHVVWGGRPPGEAQGDRDSRMQHSKRKMVKMMVIVVAVFTICWLPLNIFIVLWEIHDDDEAWAAWPGMTYVWFGCHWLAMSHSCYNPIIYGYMNARYKCGFRQVLDGSICSKIKDPLRPYQQASICDDIPLSGILCENGPVTSRHVNSKCICPRTRIVSLTNVARCSTCNALRQVKLTGPTSTTVPVQAMAIRSHFF